MDITTLAELKQAMAEADVACGIALTVSMDEMLSGSPLGMSPDSLERAGNAYRIRADLWDLVPMLVRKGDEPAALLLCRASATCAMRDREVANAYWGMAQRARARIARAN